MNIKDKIIKLFYEFAGIPHTSGNTQRFIGYLDHYAREKGFETEISNGNLIIIIPASKGFENKPPVIVQGHADMVGVKTESSKFDFEFDPLILELDEKRNNLTAKETTLGADDAIAIVYIMLLLEEEKTFKHPKIYCVITRDEEIGLLGAKDLNVSLISDAKTILNLDTEQEGLLVCGSSGGQVIKGNFHCDSKLALGSVYEVSVDGLRGGHSGGAINANGAQAAKLLAQVLGHLCQTFQIQLVSFDCPGLTNAITKSGKARFITTAKHEELVNSCLDMLKLIASSYGRTEPDIKLNLSVISQADKLQAFTRQSTINIIFDILYVPYGVQTSLNGFPTTSINIGSCVARNNSLEIVLHERFADPNLGELVKNKIIQYFCFRSAQFEISNLDPPWMRKLDSNLRKIAIETWKDLYGTPMNEVDIHATLETGVFNQMLPEAEIISFGPTVANIHTPNETLDLNSSVRVYNYLKKLLEKLGE